MDNEQASNTLKSIIECLKNDSNSNEVFYIELKENNIDPDLIGRSISAIANSCTLNDAKEKGYLVFGVSDLTLEKKGVTFDPFNVKYGSSGQDLEMWLRQMVLGVDFRFIAFKEADEKSYLLIQISKALGRIATFQKKSYIRIGKNTSDLHTYPDLEKNIWSKLDKGIFWKLPVKENLLPENVLTLLDYKSYFQMIKLPIPTTPDLTLERFEQEGFIKNEGGSWQITNLGALLFAVDMKDFPSLQYKTPRVITYQGDNKLSTVIKDNEGKRGYANSFQSLINWIDSQIPEPQEITKTFRNQKKGYPDKAIRELVANALIHQDYELEGMRPLIEIYANHIEISNPGKCLVDPDRLLGTIPKARNEILVDIMKRLYICETRGSGIPRTIKEVEQEFLPPPTFTNQENGFKVSLYSHKHFDSLSNDEKLRACVQHVSLMYILGEQANNETLRKRFGLGEKKSNTISKLVKLAKDKDLIKDFDPKNNSKKYIKYVPFWA